MGAPADVTLFVNGSRAELPESALLLLAVRDHLGLTGAKLGCGEGACGACTVLVEGEPVKSCQRTAGSVAGRHITTIEGLTGAEGQLLHPVQRAFAQAGAAQCGYCTSGMVLCASALIAGNASPDDRAIDAALDGQICRCGCYPRIRQAVHTAAAISRGEEAESEQLPAVGTPDADRWGPPEPSSTCRRPARPWDLTDPAERDWFSVLPDGLIVVLDAPPPQRHVTTSRGAWLHIDADGAVTAFTGKVDVGQDNRTALRLLVAEELGVPLGKIRLAMGDTDVCPFDMGTFGSRSMPDAGGALRTAAAYARTQLPVQPGERRVVIVAGEPRQSEPTGWQQAGREYLAPGVVAAVTGGRRFCSDLKATGMLHGAVLRPPVPAATLRSIDSSLLDGRDGVSVVRTADLVGVVTADSATAANAVGHLAATAQWDIPDAPSDDDIARHLREHPAQAQPSGWGAAFSHQQGSAATALENAAIRVEATYTTAYIAPAALETRVALAMWDDGRLTVWTGTQTPFPVRAQVAAALGVAEQDVRVIVPATGGGFGGKHAAGIATEAAILARQAGLPVRVAWSRGEEFTVGTLRPAAVIDISAGVTQDGKLSGWTHRTINAGAAGIRTPYRIADQRLDYQPADSPLPQSSYRALAATANNFARESMIDELARRVGQDPVEFRLHNLADERLADVVRAVAEHIGWEAGQTGVGGMGVGIACGLEKDGRVATAAQVAIGTGGQVRVTGLVTGYECGAIVNPRTVRNQIEGATVMALGGALFEAIRFTDGAITNGGFSSYRVPRLTDVPPIEVILLDRPDLPSAGAGETPMIAVAPAIAAAIISARGATGERLRSLPLTNDGFLPER